MKGKVETYIDGIIASGSGVFMGVIDPPKFSPEKAAELARMLEENGCDVIQLGGSIGAHGPVLDQVTKAIKQAVKIPVNLFPGNMGTVTPYADSIYFMSLLNSNNPYWISSAPILGALNIKKANLEPIPTAYLIFEPGETAGWIGEARLLPRKKPDVGVAYALAAQYLGMRFAILESGSGAPEPVPTQIVGAIRKYADLNIVIAGGVKTPQQAKALVAAGANCIHVGTMIEDSKNPAEKIRQFAKAIHGK